MAPPAAGQATATATPDRAGAGTRLHAELDASQPPVSGRVPRETVLSVQRGYRFDGRAVARRCTPTQAEADECPARSRVGSALVRATYNGFPVEVPIRLYLMRPQQGGDLAGFAAVAEVLGSTYAAFGRVVRATEDPFGLSVILPTPGPDLSDQPVTFDSFEADLGAFRTVVVKRGGKRRKVRRALIRNPATCTGGSWASQAVLSFDEGDPATLDAPIACRP
jgi:hypothetical protein